MSSKYQDHSQTSPSLCEFFSEVESMKESASAIEPSSKETDVVESIQDDTEKASEFLSFLGLKLSAGVSEFALERRRNLQAILTEDQVATIKRRVDTVRSKKSTVRKDVRSVFLPEDEVSCGGQDNSNKEEEEEEEEEDDDCPKELLSTMHITDDDDDDDELDDGAGDEHLHERGIIDGVVEEKDFQVKESKLYSSKGVSKAHKKDFLGLSNIFSRHEHKSSMPPTPNLYPDKVDRSIAMEVTRQEDLGSKDRTTLEALAHIELVGVFDKFKLDVLKHKSSKKIKHDKEGVFGVNLQTLVERDNEKGDNNKVPRFLKELLTYLEDNFLRKEGILRLSGSFTRIKELRKQIDDTWYSHQPSLNTSSNGFSTCLHSSSTSFSPSPPYSSSSTPSFKTATPSSNHREPFTFDGLRANDAVGLLKLFLRDLPSPLLTLQWMNCFVQVAKIPNACMQCYSISLLMLLLPDVNRNTLKLLLSFLHKVTSLEHFNKMNEQSLSMIMAPNLFLPPNSLSHPSSGNDLAGMDKDLGVASSCTAVIQLMLKHLNEIFIVPANLINQIRQKNHQEKKKKNKFWTKKEKHNIKKPDPKINISVQLEPYPDLVKFRPKRHSTVADVINSIVMHSKSRSNSPLPHEILRNFCMYEIGGNIGQRRLENSTMLSNIMTVNPDASYVIRPLPPTSPLSNPM